VLIPHTRPSLLGPDRPSIHRLSKSVRTPPGYNSPSSGSAKQK
jgi:hypothetical protein